MENKKKYPPIEPEFSKDKKEVYLDLKVYESIFQEMEDLQDKLKNFDNKQKKTKKSKSRK
jgi:hypothetical protein